MKSTHVCVRATTVMNTARDKGEMNARRGNELRVIAATRFI